MQSDSSDQWRLSATADGLLNELTELQKKSVILPYEHAYLTEKFKRYLDSPQQESPFLIEGINKSIIIIKKSHDEFDLIIKRTTEVLDHITLLPTRAALFSELAHWISTNDSPNIVALFILELDDFSQINDTLTHSIGDLILFQIARRLETYQEYSFKLVRLHGDEFGFAVQGLPNIEACWQVATWLSQCFEQPFETPKESLYVKPSIGFSVFPHIADEHIGLMRTAYIALNKSKLDETQHTYFYDTQYEEGLRENLEIESELKDALQHNQELIAYYQPKQALRNDSIEGVEALIRWVHPVKGLISPGHFIPVAESTGLICDITNYIVNAVCLHLPVIRECGFSGPVSINISARDFARKDFVSDICRILEENNVSPKDIELEITEGAFISDFNYCCEILTTLGNKGFQLSIDDFGTGYSSLSYLRKLPVDVLKIDMSFVRDIEKSTSVYKTFGALIQIADALNLKVVAEGVDSAEQVEKLRELECELIQGYYLSKPKPLEEFCEYLKTQKVI